MSDLLPLQVVYAGLAGAFLALVVAAATNGWSLRVFLLLTLRLAIGWHFLFEGLHKIHSHEVGVTEATRPFTSEPYFAVAQGPFGEYVRNKYLGDSDAIITERIAPSDASKIGEFDVMSAEEKAALCPKPVADALEKAAADGMADATAAIDAARANAEKVTGETDLAGLRTAAAKAQAKLDEAVAALAKAKDADQDAAKLKVESAQIDAEVAQEAYAAAKAKVDGANAALAAAETRKDALENNGLRLKLTYARWVYGADRLDAKAAFVSNDVPQAVPDRLAHIALLRSQVEALEARQAEGLGSGHGIESKRTAAARMELLTAKNSLVSDAGGLVGNLIKYATGKAPAAPARPIEDADTMAMWTITIVGACLLLGFFTPIACLVGAAFLVLTYLTHPPFPWYPLPPNTEGNPLFINKNVIECVALLVIASFPTGRWMGLDALLWLGYRLLTRKRVRRA